LRLAEKQLLAHGIDLVKSDRGGNVTCHNPGQLVVYPILNLGRWKQDLHWYAHALEEVLIRTLSCYQLRAGRKARYPGVWLGNKKIAAVGLLVRRWITGHGLALNINNQIELFDLIVPCGVQEFGVTSMAEEGVSVGLVDVRNTIKSQFQRQFDCQLEKILKLQ
jgi:lipoyl(octanoyl) transferase